MVNPPPPDLDRMEVLTVVRRVLRDDHDAEPLEWEIYPFCVGLIRLPCTLIRDSLIASGPHTLDELSEFSLVRHNEGPNMRRPIIERDAWVMLLAFPLDY